MIKIVIDCNFELNKIIEDHIRHFPGIEIINNKNINSDFILIKEIENENDFYRIKELNDLPYKYDLISLVSSERFMLQLLDLHKTYFINKDKIENCLLIIDECIENFKNHKSSYIDIISNYEHVMINIHSIMFLESYGHDIIIYTVTGDFKCRKKLSVILKDLEYFGFVQIHKSYVVNEKYINSVSSKEIVLCNSTVLPVGRKFKDSVKKYLLLKEDD